jgi:hypothetical protein
MFLLQVNKLNQPIDRGRASGHGFPGTAWEPVKQPIDRGRASGHGFPGTAWEPVTWDMGSQAQPGNQ